MPHHGYVLSEGGICFHVRLVTQTAKRITPCVKEGKRVTAGPSSFTPPINALDLRAEMILVGAEECPSLGVDQKVFGQSIILSAYLL